MDIISYSLARKTQKLILEYHKEEVGLNSEAHFSSLDHRLDEIERILKDMRVNGRLEISTVVEGLLNTDFGYFSNVQYDDKKKHLILKKSGNNYIYSGYWESPILDIFDGFEKITKISKNTNETGLNKVSILYRTARSKYNIKNLEYQELKKESLFEKYLQVKISLNSKDIAKAKDLEEDFSNKDDSEEEKNKEGYTPKANIFNPNALVSFGSDAKLVNHIAATAYPQEKFREFYPNFKGFVYETRFPIDEFTGINGIGVKNSIYSGPGSQELIAGDLERGFYGEVPSSEIISGDELAKLVSVTQGSLQNSDTPWLKWAYKGKTLFRPKKAIRSHISWDHLNEKNLVYGDRVIEVNGLQYKIRLMKSVAEGYETAESNRKKTVPNSEWNHLMLPIHEQAKDASWAYPHYVEDDVPYWGIDYTDKDLHTHYIHGNGTYVWCQEHYSSGSSDPVFRGSNGVSSASYYSSGNTNSSRGWAPVLELLSN